MQRFLATCGCVLLLAALATAEPIFGNPLEEEFQELEDDSAVQSGRIFTGTGVSNGTVDARALLAALLLGILFAVVLGYSFLGEDGGGTGYGYAYQKQGQQGYGNQNFYQRSDKNFFDNDLASQMSQLAEAFKKYEVHDLDCQMYVACEASQEARHDENGQLAKDVFQIMRNMKKRGRKAVAEKDDYVAQLLDSFVYGEELQQQLKDACQKHRSKCYEATKKPAY